MAASTSIMVWGLGRKLHVSAQQDARREPQPMSSERMASTESNVSEQDVYREDPVAMWWGFALDMGSSIPLQEAQAAPASAVNVRQRPESCSRNHLSDAG